MKILVIIKKTPDTETKITLSGDGKQIDHSGTKFIINPYDEFAIEEALKIKEAQGSGEVIIASFGPSDTKEAIIRGLAMGADRGVLISDAGLEHADSLTVAKVLAAMIKDEDPQVVLCGKQAIDDDNMHVQTMVAELLGWPQVNVVNQLSIEGQSAKIEREVEGGQMEVYEASLPVVIGANKALNTPRYASLPGIMKAKKKPFKEASVGDYGLDAAQLSGSVKVTVESFSYPPEKPAGKVFQGEEVAVMVEKVVKLLREEAKVL